MYLFFDTETTGFINKSIALDHPQQARIVQLAMLVLDEEFNEINVISSLVKSSGWEITPGAQAVHGISIEDCVKYGAPIESLLTQFESFYNSCQIGICHNKDFDTRMLEIEVAHILGDKFNYVWSDKMKCTMELTTDILKLPSRIPGKYKWPKLKEAYQYFFHEEFDSAHDALADVRATARVFKHLHKHYTSALR